MGFKNDSVYRTRRILCLVIFVLLLSIIVVCISIACRGTCANHGDSHGPASAKPSAPQPAVTDTPALQTEPAQTDNPPATQTAETPAPSDGIPLVVTEGDMNAVMARLEQLKTLPSDKTIILLDVGHGGFDPGSIGLDTGVHEDELRRKGLLCLYDAHGLICRCGDQKRGYAPAQRVHETRYFRCCNQYSHEFVPGRSQC